MQRLDDIQKCGPRTTVSSDMDMHKTQVENGRTSEVIRDGSREDFISPEEATNIAGVGEFQIKLIILSGLIWMARGFERMILATAAPLLACSWTMYKWQYALLYTLTQICAILGCLLYGMWSDTYGRKMSLSASLIILFVCGVVSAGAPSFPWFTFFRAVAGFALGGLSQTWVLCSEYLPRNKRGRTIYILSFFYALGILIMLVVMYNVLENVSSWRIFVMVGAVPSLVSVICMRYFPESFRFLLATRQEFYANTVMFEMAESNKRLLKLKERNLRPFPPSKERGYLVVDLLLKPFTRPTLLFSFLGFISSISFMGLKSITPFYLKNEYVELSSLEGTVRKSFLDNVSEAIPCMNNMTEEAFGYAVWTNTLDFPAFLIYLILVDVMGRKILLSASYFLSSCFVFLLFIPSAPSEVYIALVYMARSLTLGQNLLLLLMIAETFPTSYRGTAIGLQVAIFQLGEFFSLYLTHATLELHIMIPKILYGACLFLCCFVILLLHETRGKDLQDIIPKDDERTSSNTSIIGRSEESSV